jgi:hypothetical protein
MVKKAKDRIEKITKIQPTTVRLISGNIVRIYAMRNNESLNNYLNRLIKEDVLKNGDEKTVTEYFKKETK